MPHYTGEEIENILTEFGHRSAENAEFLQTVAEAIRRLPPRGRATFIKKHYSALLRRLREAHQYAQTHAELFRMVRMNALADVADKAAYQFREAIAEIVE